MDVNDRKPTVAPKLYMSGYVFVVAAQHIINETDLTIFSFKILCKEGRMNTSKKSIGSFIFQLIVLSLFLGCASTPGRDEALDPVMAFALSENNNQMAVSTVSQEIALFDIYPLRFRSLLTIEGKRIKPKLDQLFRSPPLAFSNNGQFLIAAGINGQVMAWDSRSGNLKFSNSIETGTLDLVVTPDDGEFITIGPNIALWHINTGKLIGTLKLPPGVTATTASIPKQGKAIFVGFSNGEIGVYSLTDRNLVRTFKAHQSAVTGLAFAPDGKTFASSAGLYDPRIWNIDANMDSITSIPNSDLTVSAAHETRKTEAVKMLALILANVGSFHLVGAPTQGFLPVSADPKSQNAQYCGPKVAFSPNGRYLASTGNMSLLSTGEFQLFLTDLINNQTKTFSIYGCSVGFSKDSKIVITGGLRSPTLRYTESGKKVSTDDDVN